MLWGDGRSGRHLDLRHPEDDFLKKRKITGRRRQRKFLREEENRKKLVISGYSFYVRDIVPADKILNGVRIKVIGQTGNFM